MGSTPWYRVGAVGVPVEEARLAASIATKVCPLAYTANRGSVQGKHYFRSFLEFSRMNHRWHTQQDVTWDEYHLGKDNRNVNKALGAAGASLFACGAADVFAPPLTFGRFGPIRLKPNKSSFL
jgi:hypothetical protein